jgi:hypothetical protein
MKDVTIFYSWQSEDKKTKNFIDKALKGAVEDIGKSEEFNQPLTLDRDTQGVIGSPHIVQTILSKIDACEIFVADTSIIDVASSGKKQINQNVMFELGYAIAKHTELNVITLFNEGTGAASDRPFDLSHHRALTFSMDKDSKGEGLRKELKRVLLLHLNADKSQVIPGHSDPLYLKLKRDVASFLLRDTAAATQDSDKKDRPLDEIETLIMKVFASMPDEKRIMVVRTLGGGVLIPTGELSEELQKEIDNTDTQEIIANMDALVRKDILAVSYSQKGTPSYRPTKEGFRLTKELL